MKKLLTVILLSGCAGPSPEYVAEFEAWKMERREQLTDPDGYLSLEGLFWLTEGRNTYGTDGTKDVTFPSGAGDVVGTFVVRNDSVWHEGDSVQLVYPSDSLRRYRNGTYNWYVIPRNNTFAIRLKNSSARAIENLGALEYYPLNVKWDIVATYQAFEQPKTVNIENIAGYFYDAQSPGFLSFEVDGVRYTLDVLKEGERLFVIFGDRTNGDTTYGAGRYMYTSLPDSSGQVRLDFNTAYNPPCVFTSFATCPLPPRQNVLDVSIPAGELVYNW